MSSETISEAREHAAMSHVRSKPINSADLDESSVDHETRQRAVPMDRDLDESVDEME